MAIVVNTAWAGFSTRQPLTADSAIRQDHAETVIENEALHRSILRSLASWAETWSTTSASYVTFIEEAPITMSPTTTDTIAVTGYISDGTATITIDDGSTTASGSITEAGGSPTVQTTTIDVSSLSGSQFFAKVTLKRSSATGTLEGLQLDEQTMVAGDIA
jgi:hypothetical protein|tara:strand:- start:40 stop:522 length:483 start_codon:yes stop_codon:yes gene_type:complete